MSFDIGDYAGMTLASAKLTGYGQHVDNKGSPDPISAAFYSYSGNGLVELSDFSGPVDGVGSVNFYPNEDSPPFLDLDFFELDVTTAIQNLLDNAASYVEFRAESEAATAFINAGETDPNSSFSVDTRWPGPQLVLDFPGTAAVPEPGTLALFTWGFLAAFLKKRKKS